MNKKKLPKAVTRTADDMREAGAASDAMEWQYLPASRADANEPAEARSAATDRVVQMTPKHGAPARDVAVSAISAATSVGIDAGRRKWRAHAIVERHANFSAMGGIIPLPIVNAASVTTIIVRMVKMLSQHYGVPFERDRARAIVIGLVAGTMPTGLSALTTSSVFYFIPGANLIGLAVSSITAATCTRGIGKTFVEHFERGATLAEFQMGRP